MPKPKITFNGGAIKGAALRAFQTTMLELGETFQEVIEEIGVFSDFLKATFEFYNE